MLSIEYGKVIYNQLRGYSESSLNTLCVSRQEHNTQHALFKLLQLWQQVLDNGGFIGTILVDLSKSYYCTPHNLLISKLECYGVVKASLRLLLDYVTRRKQRTKMGSLFSSWCHINRRVAQRSTLGPLLFSVFINDLFFLYKSQKHVILQMITLFSALAKS